jgi:hypothetical protein
VDIAGEHDIKKDYTLQSAPFVKLNNYFTFTQRVFPCYDSLEKGDSPKKGFPQKKGDSAQWQLKQRLY